MSLVRGQVAEDQPAAAGVAVGTAGQQMGNFKVISAAIGADEMKGPLSRGQRPKTTGNRGGCHSGGIGRGAGGRPAADISAAGANEMKGPLSQGQRPKITGDRGGGCHRIREGHQLQDAEMQEKMVPWGAGEIVFSSQDELIQDPAQLAQLQGQQCTWEKRQQMVLEDSVEGCCGEDSRNGGATANAAANGEPVRQRLPMVAAVSRRKKHVRMAPTVRSGGTDSRSEESSDSEGADLDGGAAACAAAIEAVNCELRELQDRTVELVLERRRLEGMWDEIDAQNMEQQNAVNEEYQRQAAWQDAMNCAEMTWQDAVNEEVLLTVNNLATEVTEDILCDTFGQIGVVVGVSMLERCDPDGWSSGQVQFQHAEEAAEAQQRFDGVELCSRPMSVRATVPGEVWQLAGDGISGWHHGGGEEVV